MNKEIIEYLNAAAGTQYRTGTKKADSVINARIAEGATLDDFKKAIDNKVKNWRGTEQEIYLRPETLFGTKFWGYANEQRTDVTEGNDRRDLLKEVLRVAGLRDITEATITIYGEIMKMIPTNELAQFAVQLIREGGQMMRPDQMISEAVKKYERKAITAMLKSGKRINDYDRFLEFMQYSFRGKQICNGVTGIYKPFVVIGMDSEGNLINQFTWKKLSSQDEQTVYQWLFDNQDRIGVVEHIEPKIEEPQIEHKKDETALAIENEKVVTAVNNLADAVRVQA